MSKLISIFLILLSGNCAATEYFVSKTGSDSNSCIGEASACLSINKALSLATQPDDIVTIKAGTYVEDSKESPYWPGDGCGLFDGNVSSLCVFYSGTAGHPITIRAATGDERKVIIDSEYLRSGISLTKSDYIHIKGLVFKNNLTAGIANPGGPAPTDGPPLESNLSIGALIEGNVIDGLELPDGVNASGIYAWSTKDWIVRNNYIDCHTSTDTTHTITYSNAMQTYGTINLLVENNTVVNTRKAILFKDHYIASANPTVYVEESTVRNNLFITYESGIQYHIRATNANPAGNNLVEGNILEHQSGMPSITYSGLLSATGTHTINGSMVFRKNIVRSHSSTAILMATSNFGSMTVENNIFSGGSVAIRCGYSSGVVTYSCNLNASNYNIYAGQSKVIMDNNAPTERTYNNLTAWKAATNAQTNSLNFDSPDAQSITVAESSFANRRPLLYRGFENTVGAQKAGVYQSGNEVIGANFTYRAAPSAPN